MPAGRQSPGLLRARSPPKVPTCPAHAPAGLQSRGGGAGQAVGTQRGARSCRRGSRRTGAGGLGRAAGAVPPRPSLPCPLRGCLMPRPGHGHRAARRQLRPVDPCAGIKGARGGHAAGALPAAGAAGEVWVRCMARAGVGSAAATTAARLRVAQSHFIWGALCQQPGRSLGLLLPAAAVHPPVSCLHSPARSQPCASRKPSAPAGWLTGCRKSRPNSVRRWKLRARPRAGPWKVCGTKGEMRAAVSGGSSMQACRAPAQVVASSAALHYHSSRPQTAPPAWHAPQRCRTN